MRGNSELPPGAQGIGDVLSHLCKLMIESVLTFLVPKIVNYIGAYAILAHIPNLLLFFNLAPKAISLNFRFSLVKLCD